MPSKANPKLFPFAEQDRLGAGLLKVDDGYGPHKPIYISIGGLYGTYSEFPFNGTLQTVFNPLAPMEDQDRLLEGELKIYERTGPGIDNQKGTYYNINELTSLNEAPCFIAGTVGLDTERLKFLRHYRDDVLSHYAPGRAFITAYYKGAGQAAARFIQTHAPWSVPSLRAGLEILVDTFIKK